MRNHHNGLIIAAALLFGSAAIADTVELAYTGVDTTYTASGKYAGGEYNAYVGIYNIDVKGKGAFASFCIDIYDYAGNRGEYYKYDVTPLAKAPQSVGDVGIEMGEKGALAVKKLWDLFYKDALANPKTAASLQVAIWEVVNEKGNGKYSLKDGNFVVTGGNFDKDLTENMLKKIADYNPAQLPNLFAYVNTTDKTHYQDFIGVPDGGVTLALLGISLGGLAFFARRKES
ncbi:MAG TPA: VPDSG-CTERM sorting domain-containing protein [Verrucomicrobiota bacterium]|jgi:hypothetical protein|nr:VPDSG-CTERM sorting domain-containing protein [Verrucomicrobiota bacterium]OQC66390.1 MAG: hypothetical protein BWX48_01625 [Verrucomicrobia bacterium ADurb.Bin006]NMD21675.1 VPDSG-CTERM sorting domain-containing protein [Verrucomicrobiota bacterium]HOA61992.1 VPDSG-CTERM sorting domain-containing protein [Verrucomicrobiota bacterium]HOF49415.1 VPDSG-CTERM sorting domain-containing protein [Verrucomicrobiota bacterium]